MKKLLTLATSVLLGLGLAVVGSSTAYAGGSDSPTPYTVDQTGITLPAGDTFRDNGHVNIRTNLGNPGLHFEGKCINRTDAECAGARHAAAQFIEKSFIPWSAFGLNGEFCVSWVQISQYNEHFVEGGQAPVGMGCEQPPVDQCEAKWQNNDPEQDCFNGPEKPKPLSGEETRTGDPVCVIPADGSAIVTSEKRSWAQVPSWSKAEKSWIFGEKVFGDWEVQSTETVDDAECIPAPPEPLTGTESKDTSPVCVVPNNGKATFDLLSRDWTQTPVWRNDTHEWTFGEKEYTKWVVVETMTVDSESCVPEEPQKPKPPVQTPTRDELATTGVDSIFWLYSGGALLVGAGVLALILGLAARKRRVE